MDRLGVIEGSVGSDYPDPFFGVSRYRPQHLVRLRSRVWKDDRIPPLLKSLDSHPSVRQSSPPPSVSRYSLRPSKLTVVTEIPTKVRSGY